MKKRLIVLLGSVMVGGPLLALAQGTVNMCAGPITPLQRVLCTIRDIMNTIIPILIILAVIYFIWGVITYMIGTDEEAKKGARTKIIYGLIGLVVIVGMWGLVGLVTKTFGLDNSTYNNNIAPPCIPGTGAGC